MTEIQRFFELFDENLRSVLKDGSVTDYANKYFGLDVPRFANLRCYNFKFEGVTCNIMAERSKGSPNSHKYHFHFFKNDPYYNVMLTWVARPQENDDCLNLNVCIGNSMFAPRDHIVESWSDFSEHPNVNHFLCGNTKCENDTKVSFIKDFKTVHELLSEINFDLIGLFYTGEDQEIAQGFKVIFKPFIRSCVKNSRNVCTC